MLSSMNILVTLVTLVLSSVSPSIIRVYPTLTNNPTVAPLSVAQGQANMALPTRPSERQVGKPVYVGNSYRDALPRGSAHERDLRFELGSKMCCPEALV